VKPNFSYNYKSILAIPGKALKAKKIYVASLALLIALAVFDLAFYLAAILDGHDPAWLFMNEGFFPLGWHQFSGFMAAFVFYIGLAISVIAICIGMSAVALMDFEEIRGNIFLTPRQALRGAIVKARPMLLSWLAIAIFIIFIILLGVIIGMIARIPHIGEWLYSLFFFFPNFIVAIFTVLIILVFVLSLLVMPAALAADRKNETFTAILETFLTITRQPVRWFGYTLYSIITAKLAGFIYICFAYLAVILIQFAARLGGGEKIDEILSSGANLLPLKSKLATFTASITMPGYGISLDISQISRGFGYDNSAAWLMALSLFLIFLTAWGYILSIIATGQAYAYAVIKKWRDDYLISDEKSVFAENKFDALPVNGKELSKEKPDNNK